MLESVVNSIKEPVEEILGLVKVCIGSVVAGQLPPMDVLSLLISKGLGYAILVGASIVKIPQIVAIMSSGSAEGLSALSFELEIIGYSIGASYGYLKGLPINTYGEAIAIQLQNIYLLLMVYQYNKVSVQRRTLTFGLLTAFFIAVFQGAISISTIDALLAGSIVIFAAARVPQIVKNFMNGSTGQLSALTTLILFGGSLARIFTSVRENAGTQMVVSYSVGAILNGTILSQIILYNVLFPKKVKTQ
eukprot:TRINITY_DN10042_c0_g1_i4.p1 TRINITY_DN10042_c0_g1~~TRINITY_DN10042_c0_g1_i4.p1  ORF type:complete len:255 (+),score=16.35 TRINITY_DN10042_c0_g1_i4:27-767(+)